MDPNQTNTTGTQVADPTVQVPVDQPQPVVMPQTDPMAGQTPTADPTMPSSTPSVKPIASPSPEPVEIPVAPVVEQPVTPVEPIAPQGGDVGGEMPPTTPPTTV